MITSCAYPECVERNVHFGFLSFEPVIPATQPSSTSETEAGVIPEFEVSLDRLKNQDAGSYSMFYLPFVVLVVFSTGV
jgi:hypothetical protein